jgi:hypothetical protein
MHTVMYVMYGEKHLKTWKLRYALWKTGNMVRNTEKHGK